MNRAILLGTTGIAVALGMLAFGFMAGQQQAANASVEPQAVTVASADSAVDRGRGRDDRARLSAEQS